MSKKLSIDEEEAMKRQQQIDRQNKWVHFKKRRVAAIDKYIKRKKV